jgi:two-component sensor histidine kinase
MAGLADIARDRTDLSESAIAHLRALVAEWTLMADLGFSDLVLWLPTWNRGGFVAAAQVRPTTGPTHLPEDMVGRFLARGRVAILDRAAATLQQVTERQADRPLVPRGNEAFPVIHEGLLVAVIERHPGVGVRAEGALESTYYDAFDALVDMVRTGHFPIGEGVSITDSPPRVGDGCLRIDARGTITYASPNAQSACHRLGISVEITGSDLSRTLARILQKSGLSNDALVAIAAGRAAGASEIEQGDVVVTMRGIPLVRNGQADGAIVLVRDVTDLRRREKALLTKDATIREIHHRVKNNLQTVASMLRLQARRSSSEEVRAELEEAMRRIGAIAIVHESLAHVPGANVDFDEVIDRIIAMSRDVITGRGVIVRDGEVGALPAEIATPLAMALAELLGNAVEHGIGEAADRGEVRVSATRGDRLVIHIDDNGPGGSGAAEGLGLSIVRSLVSGELRGSLLLGPAPLGGTRATIDIPV